MLNLRKFFKSETGKKLLSIMLGLAIAGLFKMTCDKRSCLVYKAHSFEKDKKVVKYNGTCYKVEENMMKCPSNDKDLIYV